MFGFVSSSLAKLGEIRLLLSKTDNCVWMKGDLNGSEVTFNLRIPLLSMRPTLTMVIPTSPQISFLEIFRMRRAILLPSSSRAK